MPLIAGQHPATFSITEPAHDRVERAALEREINGLGAIAVGMGNADGASGYRTRNCAALRIGYRFVKQKGCPGTGCCLANETEIRGLCQSVIGIIEPERGVGMGAFLVGIVPEQASISTSIGRHGGRTTTADLGETPRIRTCDC